jgi:hypothetical protein
MLLFASCFQMTFAKSGHQLNFAATIAGQKKTRTAKILVNFIVKFYF